MLNRYTYAYGFRSREAAELALIDMFEESEISESENPKIERYETRPQISLRGEKYPPRYRITLEH